MQPAGWTLLISQSAAQQQHHMEEVAVGQRPERYTVEAAADACQVRRQCGRPTIGLGLVLGISLNVLHYKSAFKHVRVATVLP